MIELQYKTIEIDGVRYVMNKTLQVWNEFGQLGQSIGFIVFMLLVYVFVRFFVLHRMEKIVAETSNDLDDRLVHFFKQFLWVIALFFTLIIVLRINEVAISPLLAGAGIFGVALGFAAKETIADILSGIFLITDRPIRVGDRVKLENIGRHWGAWGDVMDIGLRRTQIRNTDGVVVNYPNSLLANSVISNFSFEKKPVRVRIRFQVGYGADIELTKKIALESIYSVPKVLANTAQIVVRSLWDDSRGLLLAGVLIEGRYRILDVRERTIIRSEVLERLLVNLRKHKIPLAVQPIQISQVDG